ncbi:hypothetical protein [Paludibacterium denitrificans]|nr:hypothetical protein [Paludibacterium denitrificans]
MPLIWTACWTPLPTAGNRRLMPQAGRAGAPVLSLLVGWPFRSAMM